MTERYAERQRTEPRKEVSWQEYKDKPYDGQRQPMVGQKPIVDLQVYEPYKPRPKKPSVDPSYFVPVSTNCPYYPPQYSGMPPFMYAPNHNIPIIKNYSINMGPEIDHVAVTSIFEDVLPTKQYENTMVSLGERVNILNFVRSVFIKQHDGEQITLDGSGERSLVSYLRFTDLNPYDTSQFTNNPYMSLPNGMLLYRSCYPIRYDKDRSTTICAMNSTGMNIRVYALTVGANQARKATENYYNYNVWRELAYYEYIRETILKQKVCPNFVMLYAYFMVYNSKIDFDKLDRIKKSSTKSTIMKGGLYEPYSGNALVGLTESPTYNLFGWASKTYTREGNIKRMINTGFHKSEVWHSIFFQIAVSLYVLQINKIALKEFSVEDNIYIKDISKSEQITNYWKYKIDGVEYYIPNYGFLVMFDSNYKDIVGDESTLLKRDDDKRFKILAKIFDDNEDDIDKLAFKAFETAMNPNTYSKSFTSKGGSKPSEEILEMLTSINREISSTKNTDIGYYIQTFMRPFMNNRIGTYLKENEYKNIRKDDHSEFKPGSIVVQEVQNDTYIFALYLGQSKVSDITDPNIGGGARVLVRDETRKNIIEKNVLLSSLYNYSKYDYIIQEYKPNEANLSEEDLIEIYEIFR